MNPDFDKKFGAEFLSTVPAAAGVYLFSDAAGEVIYVGKAKNLRKRLAQYRGAKAQRSQRKMRRIVRAAKHLEWRVCEGETEALLLENALIVEHRPELNVAGAYSFLYPYIGLKIDQRGWLCLGSTSNPEALEQHGFVLYGAFRSRYLVTRAFDALLYLLTFLGHYDVPARAAYGRIPFTRIAAYRQVEKAWAPLLVALLSGESHGVLPELLLTLLEKPKARLCAEDVQEHLEALKEFFAEEARPLREALRHAGREGTSIAQKERDGLFITLRSRNLS